MAGQGDCVKEAIERLTCRLLLRHFSFGCGPCGSFFGHRFGVKAVFDRAGSGTRQKEEFLRSAKTLEKRHKSARKWLKNG